VDQEPESVLSTITPNGQDGEYTEYHHPDRPGTRLVTNQSGGTSYEQMHLPFGNGLDAESTGLTGRRFTSYERSARTGLNYAQNRTYDPKHGRFTQVDPIAMGSVELSNPQTLNLYAYCTDDPVNYIDPSGLGFFSFLKKLFKWVLIVVAVVVAVALVIIAAAFVAAVVFNVTLPAFLGGGSGFLGILGSIAGKIGGAMSFMAGAIGVEVGASTGGYIAASLFGAAVGAISNSFARQDKRRRKVPLRGKELKDYVTVVGNALKRLKDKKSDCYKFLKEKGFDPERIYRKLRKNTPYDITRSTNSAADINRLYVQYTIKGLFNGPNAPLSGTRAATSASGRNVYYDPSGIRVSTMIHETIHQTSGITDPDLAKKIGVSNEDYQKEHSIDDALEKGGCK
jgi:RHS repeat-associated protein